MATVPDASSKPTLSGVVNELEAITDSIFQKLELVEDSKEVPKAGSKLEVEIQRVELVVEKLQRVGRVLELL